VAAGTLLQLHLTVFPNALGRLAVIPGIHLTTPIRITATTPTAEAVDEIETDCLPSYLTLYQESRLNVW